eukprot:5714029-Pleurochrysis_carterae.AAC.3
MAAPATVRRGRGGLGHARGGLSSRRGVRGLLRGRALHASVIGAVLRRWRDLRLRQSSTASSSFGRLRRVAGHLCMSGLRLP